MKDFISLEAINRRDLLLGFGVAGAAVVLLAGVPAQAQADDSWEAALKKVVGDAKPIEGKITLDMPEIAENGNTVPFSVSVDSPMTEQEFVKAVHVFSTGNPQPVVATFHFSPQSGKAAVSSRMRLAKTQDIVCVAELSDGQFALAKRTVKVTIGGCGG
ncbi:MAG: thiosulfate oxidation carrier protein SoxY [Hyphomicrobiaceae bacterium]|nr:thiosulfate oxidation carrier protein SoxY [Hyphomicrobiaceae bacterium]